VASDDLLLAPHGDAGVDGSHPGAGAVDLLGPGARLQPRQGLLLRGEPRFEDLTPGPRVVAGLGGAGAAIEQALHAVEVLPAPARSASVARIWASISAMSSLRAPASRRRRSAPA
jgi:hypothetical protein